MSPEERKNALTQAAALIRQVAHSLDRSSKPCRCCDAKRYTNLTEARAAEQLAAVAGKVDEQKRRLSSFATAGGTS